MSDKAIVLTLGDPNGLGPELVCRLMGSSYLPLNCKHILIIGLEKSLEYYCQLFNIPVFWHKLEDIHALSSKDPGIYCFTPSEIENIDLNPGRADKQGGLVAGISLKTACSVLRSKIAQGLVTCPLNKAMLKEAGFAFSGHTEFLAAQFGLDPSEVCMHLAGSKLRVSLVTTHFALRKIPDLISQKKIIRCLELTWKLVNDLNLSDKPIVVCGLNPHAGEEGMLGYEEKEIIVPAIKKAQDRGIKVVGPYPADTVFFYAAKQKYSAVLAMYHDQGLAPLKLLHFNQAVNITLGLPVVRTSVDHGTGYDIVGKEVAETTSLYKALEMAENLLQVKQL